AIISRTKKRAMEFLHRFGTMSFALPRDQKKIMHKFLLLWLISFGAWAQENRHWLAAKESVGLIFTGAYKQFSQINNLGYAALAAPSLLVAFEEDDRLARHYRGKQVSSAVNLVGDLGVVLNMPIASAGLYFVGDGSDNPKLVQFAKELFA